MDNTYYENKLLYVQTIWGTDFSEYFVGKEAHLIAENIASLNVKMESNIWNVYENNEYEVYCEDGRCSGRCLK
jgi:hypothetical protein